MWQDYPPERLQSTADFLEVQLQRTDLAAEEIAQFERIRDTLQQRLGALGIQAAPEQPVADPDLETSAEPEAEPDPVSEETEQVTDEMVPETTPEEPVIPEETNDVDEDEEESESADEPLETIPTQNPEPEPAVIQVEPEPETIKPAPSISDKVESGASGIWKGRRYGGRKRQFSDQEINWLKALGYRDSDERSRGQEVTLVRFDPLLGAFGRHGNMLADATDSPTIRDNMDIIIEVASYLSSLSQQFDEGAYFRHLSIERVLSELGHEGLEPLQQRYLTRELQRILSPTRAIHILKSSMYNTYDVHFHAPFMFVVTELTPRKYRHAVASDNEESICHANTWPADDCDEARVCDMLLNRTVPRPSNHQQAETLLSAIMTGEELFTRMSEVMSAEARQAVIDLAHCFVLEELGWQSYTLARKSRTIRSGRPGQSGVIRQVTGVQENERFDKRSQAPTASKSDVN